MKTEEKIIAIVGPTASGKTGIGVWVAKNFNGEIVSADSRQVFRGLDLGSGKEGEPSKTIANSHFAVFNEFLKNKYSNDQITQKWKLINEKLRPNLRYIDGVPQWLIDIQEPGEEFHLFEFIDLANLAIEDIQSRGKLPVIVGGTGLYIQGLIEGFQLNQKPNIGNKKPYSRVELEGFSKEKLQSVLSEMDRMAFEKVDINNPHRLIRAIERAQEGTEMIKVAPDYEVLQIGMNWPRETLYARIDKRVEERFNQGMLEEVIGLLKQGVDPGWLMKLGLEYREITKYLIALIDQIDLSNAKQLEQFKSSKEFKGMEQVLKYKIHQFAKRQCTWFNRFPGIVWEIDERKINAMINDYLKD